MTDQPRMTTANIPKLNGKNYASWHEMIGMFLELNDLDIAVTSDSKDLDKKIDTRAQFYIKETLDESHRSQVRGYSTAKLIMERLASVYADKSEANVHRMLLKYYRYQKIDTDNMSEHIGKLDDMRMALEALGEKQSEKLAQVIILGSLPAEYSGVMELWESTHPDLRKRENLISRLIKKKT